ncbi:hypothetical protein RRF57_012394 [Xylaria bambusicola]|uniref:Uncharacterized protein n=1 Tax=Xylaria bambusicola TaxID=326684 RepID=A0AAN7ZAP1_9PEZI
MLLKSRRHDVEKVFLDPLFLELFEDERRIDYMLHGVVDLELKSGGEITRQWAARGVLREDEKGLKYTFYQVYFNN